MLGFCICEGSWNQSPHRYRRITGVRFFGESDSYADFQLLGGGVGVPNPCIVQGSTVLHSLWMSLPFYAAAFTVTV